MTVSLYRSTAARLAPVAEFADAAAALAHVATFGESYIEEDTDHPGCFDIFVYATGDVFAVQPADFRL